MPAAFDARYDALWARVPKSDLGLALRDSTWLTWRFASKPGGHYRIFELSRGAELAGYVTQGYRAVKLKTGALSRDDEVQRIAATHQAIGPDVLLMLDMNAAYDLPECIEFAHAVEPHRIFWLEEPLHWYLQPADFARLAAITETLAGYSGAVASIYAVNAVFGGTCLALAISLSYFEVACGAGPAADSALTSLIFSPNAVICGHL